MPAKNNKVARHGREGDSDKAPVIVAIGASAGGIPSPELFQWNSAKHWRCIHRGFAS